MYNLSFLILLLKLFQLWPLGASSVQLLCSFNRPELSSRTSLHSGTTSVNLDFLILESATFPKSPGSFYWKMVFGNKNLGIIPEASLLLGRQSQEIHICIHMNPHIYTSVFLYLSRLNSTQFTLILIPTKHDRIHFHFSLSAFFLSPTMRNLRSYLPNLFI